MRRDLSALARVLWWALIALIAVGVVLVLDLLNVFQFFLSLHSESQLTAQTAPRTTRRT
jgi:FtsH-binding integral membrane protein